MLPASPVVEKQWWFLNEFGTVQGPFPTQAFISFFSSGVVDGLTKVTDDIAALPDDWVAVAEHIVLRDVLRPFSQTSGQGQGLDNSVARVTKSSLCSGNVDVGRSDTFARDGQDAILAQQESAVRVVHQETSMSPNMDLAQTRERKRQSRKRAREAKRRRKQQNTSVYVKGIPKDVTENELAEHFVKCGILQPDPGTGRPRIKIYLDAAGNPKGDALLTYAMAPSVENAITILDDVPLRAGGEALIVERASFEHKEVQGNNDTEKTAKQGQEGMESKERKRRGLRSKALVSEALSWAEEGQGQEVCSAPRIVILKNVFDREDANYTMIQEDMEEGCAACGVVEKITVFERNTEGAVAIKFSTLEACVKCIEVMNGRWYDGRRLSAEFYDGTTNYRYEESAEERSVRETQWKEWLERGTD